jgi:hypothetical protein
MCYHLVPGLPLILFDRLNPTSKSSYWLVKCNDYLERKRKLCDWSLSKVKNGAMTFSQRATGHFLMMIIRQVDEMTSWWNDELMKWWVDEMTSWWSDNLMNWQVDEMTSWWNDKLMKWQVDEMTSWWNDKLIK